MRATERAQPEKNQAEKSLWKGQLECSWHRLHYSLDTGENTHPASVYPDDIPQLQNELNGNLLTSRQAQESSGPGKARFEGITFIQSSLARRRKTD